MATPALPHHSHRPPRVARTLARQLDRLARRAHAFHRYAHHPLCDRYAGEVLRFRQRTRICRGCTFALLGATFGFAIGTALPITAMFACSVSGFASVAAAVSVGRHPLRSAPRRRFSKLLTRALPAAGLAFGLGWCVRAQDGPALALALGILSVTYTLHQYYKQRGPDRTPCSDCPERGQVVPCSGFRDIVRAERAFVRRSHALLDP